MRVAGAVLGLLVFAGCSSSRGAAPPGTERGSGGEPACSAPGPRAGQLDLDFGGAGTGIARLRFGADDDGGFFGLSVVGREILAAGWGLGGLGGTSFRVARLSASGSPDPSFGGTGLVSTRWAPSTGDYPFGVAAGRQSDGSVVAIGWRDQFRSTPADIALAAFAPDGTLGGAAGDFGVGGRSLVDLGGAEQILDGVVLRSGAVVVVGKRDERLVVARVTARGALDPSFASPNGYLTVAIGQSSVARSVAVDTQGRILVAGHADIGGQLDMVVLRLTPSGALDPSFGSGGALVTGDPGTDERAVGVALAPCGRIVVAGDTGSAAARDFQVRRLLTDGSPDPAFGAGGVSSPAITRGDDQAESMVVLPGGGVLVLGNTVGGGDTQPLLARYTCAGALEPGFGSGGVLPIDLGEFGVAHTVEVYSRDRVVIGGGDVGATPGPGTYGVVARLFL